MAIIGTLPYTLTNGSLANADEVMADFNAIVSQVNSNALPSGGTLTAGLEWTLLTDAPTYVSTTSFTMPGDQTATFTIGRRVKSVNTGGTIYSTVTGATVVLDTTVTVTNSAGVLDAGLSAVSIGTLNATNESVPAMTDLMVGGILQNNVVPASASTILFQNFSSVIYGDVLSEWSNDAAAKFTPKVAGTYIFSICGYLSVFGANVTNGQQFLIQVDKNGGNSQIMSWLAWPLSSGVQGNVAFPLSGSVSRAMSVGDYVQFRILTPAFTVTTITYAANLAIRRLPYPFP